MQQHNPIWSKIDNVTDVQTANGNGLFVIKTSLNIKESVKVRLIVGSKKKASMKDKYVYIFKKKLKNAGQQMQKVFRRAKYFFLKEPDYILETQLSYLYQTPLFWNRLQE